MEESAVKLSDTHVLLEVLCVVVEMVFQHRAILGDEVVERFGLAGAHVRLGVKPVALTQALKRAVARR